MCYGTENLNVFLVVLLSSCNQDIESFYGAKQTMSPGNMEIVVIDKNGKEITSVNETKMLTKSSSSIWNEGETALAIRFKDEGALKAFMENKADNDDSSLLIEKIKEEFPTFVSMLDIYNEAMEWSDKNLDETMESYQNWKNLYGKSLYFPEYMEDYGAYLPVSNLSLAAVSNSNCNVVVGDKILNTRDIFNYDDLQNKGLDAYYSQEEETSNSPQINTRAAIVNHQYRLMGSFANCNEEYDSGWEQKNNRKLRVKVGRQVGGNGIRIHIEISFRKKGVFGWSNYSSETDSEFTYRGTTYTGLKKNANSSHDWYFNDRIFDGPTIQDYYMGDINTKYWSNYISAKPWSISVGFRGFGEQYAGYKFQRSSVIPHMKFYWPM